MILRVQARQRAPLLGAFGFEVTCAWETAFIDMFVFAAIRWISHLTTIHPHLEFPPTRNAVRVPSAGLDRTLDSNPLSFCSLDTPVLLQTRLRSGAGAEEIGLCLVSQVGRPVWLFVRLITTDMPSIRHAKPLTSCDLQDLFL